LFNEHAHHWLNQSKAPIHCSAGKKASVPFAFSGIKFKPSLNCIELFTLKKSQAACLMAKSRKQNPSKTKRDFLRIATTQHYIEMPIDLS